MKQLFPILFLIMLTTKATAGDLKPFQSDGCSAFPDGTIKQGNLWLKCCIEHDKQYWKGGTYKEREKADEDLKICVEKTGEPDVAQLMLAGVRVGGTPYLPTEFRWGYGWPYPRWYVSLTEDEKIEVELKSNPSKGK